MPQDAPDAVSPRAPFSGQFEPPEQGLTHRWFDASELTPAMRDEVLAVLEIAFNDEVSWYELPATPADHFDWKFRDRPTGVTIFLTQEASGRIVGFSAGVRRNWRVNGRPYVNRSSQDLARLPEWQGRGLGRAFQRFYREDWHPSEDIALAQATHPADRRLAVENGARVPANSRHLGSVGRARRTVQRVRRLFRPQPSEAGPTKPVSNTARVLADRERPRGARARDLIHRAALVAASLLARRRAPSIDGLTIETVTRFEPQHEAFITASIRPFEFIGERSIEYLNWRHCDVRGGPFTVRLARRHGADVGYAVTRVLNGTAHLADILVVPGQRVVAEALVRDAIDLARAGAPRSSRPRCRSTTRTRRR